MKNEEDRNLLRALAGKLGIAISFGDEEVPTQDATEGLDPFDPVEEIKAGRYEFDFELGIGKLNHVYVEPRFDVHGCQFLCASFPDDYLDFIDRSRLPDECFIPTRTQIDKWNKKHLGDGWRDHPDEVLSLYGVKRYGDNYAGRIESVGEAVHLASASRNENGNRYFLYVNKDYSNLNWYNRWQCGFVPVFFSEEFLSSSLSALQNQSLVPIARTHPLETSSSDNFSSFQDTILHSLGLSSPH